MSATRIAQAVSATLLLITLGACSSATEKAEQKPVEKVNGVAITQMQVDRGLQALLAQRKGAPALPPEQMKKAAGAVLEQLTATELLYQEAAKLEVKDLDKQVAEKFASNKARFPTEAEFQKALTDMHMTVKEMQENMRKEIVVNNFINTEFASKVNVSDADAKKFYDENLDKLFRKGERVKASHILVSVDPKATPEAKKQAKDKAEALLKRVQGGEDFAALAKKESDCPSSARGGDLGEFPRGQMTPPFDKAVFSLKPNEISPVVETEFGYHVIKLTAKLPPATASFEEVKEKIVYHLKKEQVKKAVATCIAGLRSKAKIEKV